MCDFLFTRLSDVYHFEEFSSFEITAKNESASSDNDETSGVLLKGSSVLLS